MMMYEEKKSSLWGSILRVKRMSTLYLFPSVITFLPQGDLRLYYVYELSANPHVIHKNPKFKVD